jgi:hypothetical protein
MLEHQDQKDQTDHQVMQVPQALMVTPEIKDLADPLAHPAHLETQETKDQLATPAKSLAPNPAHQAQPAPTANPVHQALQADLAKLVKTAALALQVPQEMQALQAVQAKLAVPAAPVMQAKTAHLAAANTAHQLVWLQVIKHPRSERLDDKNFHRQIYDSNYFYSLPHDPKIDVIENIAIKFSFSSQTFHVENFYFYLIAFFLNTPLFKQFAVFGSLV